MRSSSASVAEVVVNPPLSTQQPVSTLTAFGVPPSSRSTAGATTSKHHQQRCFHLPDIADTVVRACAWSDGGAEFVFGDGTVLSFLNNMETFVAVSVADPGKRDMMLTTLALSVYRAKVTAALELYNLRAVHPMLIDGFVPEDEVRVWSSSAPLDNTVLCDDAILYDAATQTLRCALGHVSLQLHQNGRLFSVTWPATLVDTEGCRRIFVTKSSSSAGQSDGQQWNAGGGGVMMAVPQQPQQQSSAVLAYSGGGAVVRAMKYVMLRQIFSVAACPECWAPMLGLALSRQAAAAVAGAATTPAVDSDYGQTISLQLPATNEARKRTMKFSNIEVGDAQAFVAKSEIHSVGLNIIAKLHPNATVAWRFDSTSAASAARCPPALYIPLTASGSGTAADIIGAAGTTIDERCVVCEAFVFEDESVVAAEPNGRTAFCVAHFIPFPSTTSSSSASPPSLPARRGPTADATDHHQTQQQQLEPRVYSCTADDASASLPKVVVYPPGSSAYQSQHQQQNANGSLVSDAEVSAEGGESAARRPPSSSNNNASSSASATSWVPSGKAGRYLPEVGHTAISISLHNLQVWRRQQQEQDQRNQLVTLRAADHLGNSGTIVRKCSRLEGVGVFTALTNGVIRGHFEDKTIVTLIPDQHDTESGLVVSLLSSTAESMQLRAVQCGPSHPAHPYLLYMIPFRRYALLTPQDEQQLGLQQPPQQQHALAGINNSYTHSQQAEPARTASAVLPPPSSPPTPVVAAAASRTSAGARGAALPVTPTDQAIIHHREDEGARSAAAVVGADSSASIRGNPQLPPSPKTAARNKYGGLNASSSSACASAALLGHAGQDNSQHNTGGGSSSAAAAAAIGGATNLDALLSRTRAALSESDMLRARARELLLEEADQQ